MTQAALCALLLVLAGCTNASVPTSQTDSAGANASASPPLEVPHRNPKMDGPPGE